MIGWFTTVWRWLKCKFLDCPKREKYELLLKSEEWNVSFPLYEKCYDCSRIEAKYTKVNYKNIVKTIYDEMSMDKDWVVVIVSDSGVKALTKDGKEFLEIMENIENEIY